MSSEQTECYLCGCHEFYVLHQNVQEIQGLNVLKCRACGFVTLSDFSHITPDYYKAQKMHERAEQSWDEWVDETRVDDHRRLKMTYHQINGKSLLDIGCGNLGFLKLARPHVLVADGVEPDRTFEAHTSLSEGTIFHSIEGAIDSGKRYDVITMFHLLEHLADPIEFLNKVTRLLTPDGVLFIETPNAKDALLNLYDCKAFKEFSYWEAHLHLYSYGPLATVTQRAGFQKLNIMTFQRYPLANHLHWLAKEAPGGHHIWRMFFGDSILNEAYEKALRESGCCDTLWGMFQ